MLKHQELISKLSDSQKVYMLTSAGKLTGKDMKILGIPEIKSGDMKDYCRNLIPNSTALSHAWDKELWCKVSEQKSHQMINDNVNFALTNGPKIKFSPYRREISEDTHLATEFAKSMLKGAKNAGILAGSSGMSLTESDIEWMDVMPNERVINELLTYPFVNSVINSEDCSLVGDLRSVDKTYQDSCYDSLQNISNLINFKVCKKATDENTIKFISNGIICLEGSKNSLEAAIARYKKLKRSIEMNEGATQAQLDSELEDLTAISLETVDKSLDNLIDFIYSCVKFNKYYSTVTENVDNVAFASTLKSSVLLKNDNCLPLNKKNRIAIVGDILSREVDNVSHIDKLAEGLSKKGFRYAGFAKGYDFANQRSNEFAKEALDLAFRADTILVFLGMGYEREKLVPKTKSLTLPANQLFIVKKLIECNKTVVGVISSGQTVDVEFTRSLDGLIIAPLEVKYSADALLTLLTGDSDFEGRLAYTLYSGSDVGFNKKEYYKQSQNAKSGVFVGYRYYDTANLTLGYPFGYGLSYAKFKYSFLNANSKYATVYVQNVSSVPGYETVQLYVGAENSSVIRPKKELCAFEKVFLMPGEKKKVVLYYEIPKIYNEKEFVIEAGKYLLSVGSSVDNVYLSTSIRFKGVKLIPDKENSADYLQSVSNVVSNNYTLEANYNIMKMSIRNILFGILFVLIAISLAVFNSMIESPSMFINIIAGVLSVVSVMFFVSEAIERSRIYAEERKRIDFANQELFKEAEEIPVFSTEEIFNEEFAVESDEDMIDEVVVETVSEADVLQYVNKDFKFANAVQDLRKFFLTRGYKLNGATVENLLASLASSKILVTQGVIHEDFNKICALLSEYFGTSAFVDVHGEHESSTAFYSTDYHGDQTKKNLLLALEYARDNPDKLVIAALDGADVTALEDYVSPFYKYSYFAKSNNRITVKLENGSTASYNVTNNFRLFINLNDKTSIDAIPYHIASLSSTNYLDYAVTHTGDAPSTHFDLNKYQLDYILEKEGKDANLSEDCWKKIDKLVKYVNGFVSFKISNKTWISLEKLVSLLLSAGLSPNDVLDLSVGNKILSSMAVILKGKINEDDKSLYEYVEFALGEQKADYCKKSLKYLTVNPNKLDAQKVVASQPVQPNVVQ